MNNQMDGRPLRSLPIDMEGWQRKLIHQHAMKVANGDPEKMIMLIGFFIFVYDDMMGHDKKIAVYDDQTGERWL